MTTTTTTAAMPMAGHLPARAGRKKLTRLRAAAAFEGGLKEEQHDNLRGEIGNASSSSSLSPSAKWCLPSPLAAAERNRRPRPRRRRRAHLLAMAVAGAVGAVGLLQRSSTLPPASLGAGSSTSSRNSGITSGSAHGGMLELRDGPGSGSGGSGVATAAVGLVSRLLGLGNYNHNHHGRSLLLASLTLPTGARCPTSDPPPSSLSPVPLSDPTVVASYPGSGAKMTWKLIEGLTHLATGDEHITHLRDIGREVVPFDRYVTVKAHFPHKMGDEVMRGETITEVDYEHVPDDYHHNYKEEQQEEERDEEEMVDLQQPHQPHQSRTFTRAILLLRNPAEALPGYHNFLYEQQHNLENHSTRAPLEEWVGWRDANFAEEIAAWEDHVVYWMTRYARYGGGADSNHSGDSNGNGKRERLVLTYEGMTGEESGPRAAHVLADFLDEVDGVDPVRGTDVDCVWTRIVKYKGEDPPPTTTTPEADEGEDEVEQRQQEEEQQDGDEEGAATVSVEAERRDRRLLHRRQRRRRLQLDTRDSIARTGSKFRPYTQQQVVEMLAMLNRLRDRFGADINDNDHDSDNDDRNDNADLLSALDFYFEQIRTLADVEQREPLPSTAAEADRQYLIPAATTTGAGIRGSQTGQMAVTPDLAVYDQALRRVDEPDSLSPTDKAFFLHVPKAGGTSIEAYYGNCLDIPMPHIDAEEGIDPNAFEEASFLKTNMMYHMSLFQDKPFKARAFTVLRHPVEVVHSEYYYLQRAEWEKGYNKDLGNEMSLAEFAAFRPNRLTENLLKLDREEHPLLTDESLAKAKTILRDYVMVGLLDRMEESFARFDAYLGIPDLVGDEEKIEECRALVGSSHFNSGKHSKLVEDSEEWKQVAAHNEYDIALYEYAVQLFSEQGNSYLQ